MTTEREQLIPAYTAADLYRKLLRAESLLILDVCNAEAVERFRIESQQSLQSMYIPYFARPLWYA